MFIKEQLPKSSFLSTEKDMNIIIEMPLVDVKDKRKYFILCSLSTRRYVSPGCDLLSL